MITDEEKNIVRRSSSIVETRSSRRAKRISEIISTASKIFVRDGYVQFSARKVAGELGISLSNLQHYCGTTENLLLKMLQANIAVFISNLDEIASRADLSPEERFVAMIDPNMEAVRDPWTASFSFQAWALSDHDPMIHQSLSQMYKQYSGIIANLIAEVNPHWSTEQCQVNAVLIASHVEGLMIYSSHDAVFDWSAILKAIRTSWIALVIPPK